MAGELAGIQAAQTVETLYAAFRADHITNGEIFDALDGALGLSYDDVQRLRKEYRQAQGLPPLKRGPKAAKTVKPGQFVPADTVVLPATEQVIIHKWDETQWNELIYTIEQLGKGLRP